MITTEKRFEEDIESFLLTEQGGYIKTTDTYDPSVGLYVNTFIDFIKATQPKEWARFEKTCGSDPVKKFVLAFNNACDADGLLYILRHGFKHRGIPFRVCYFKPESHLNKTANDLYKQNVCNCVRQWYYSTVNKNSIDMVLVLNGIPVIALELKISTQDRPLTMPKNSGCMTVTQERYALTSTSVFLLITALTTQTHI